MDGLVFDNRSLRIEVVVALKLTFVDDLGQSIVSGSHGNDPVLDFADTLSGYLEGSLGEDDIVVIKGDKLLGV